MAHYNLPTPAFSGKPDVHRSEVTLAQYEMEGHVGQKRFAFPQNPSSGTNCDRQLREGVSKQIPGSPGGCNVGININQRKFSREPSHGSRAGPRSDGAQQDHGSGSAPSGCCGENKLGQTWPILENFGSPTNPVPPLSRSTPIAPELNLNDICMGRGTRGLC